MAELKKDPKTGVVKVDKDVKTEEFIKKTIASDADLQLYYYILGNTFKIYKQYKENTHLYRNSGACDKCYQVFFKRDMGFHKHCDLDVCLCSECFEGIEDKFKELYTAVDCAVDDRTGVKFC